MKSLELKTHSRLFSLLQSTASTLLLSAASTAVIANADTQKSETRWYQADIIVFLNKHSMNGSEKWPDIRIHPLPAHATKLKPYDTSTGNKHSLSNLTHFLDQPDTKAAIDLERDPFISLPYESQLLQKQGNALSESSNYRILDQKAWLMPINQGQSTLPVQIRSDNTQDELPSLLEGTVTVNSRRYLHVNVNFWYSELSQEGLARHMGDSQYSEPQQQPMVNIEQQRVAAPDKKPMKVSRNFQLQESRRIRHPGEVQYLDSPVIGILFKLTPYERPDAPFLPGMRPNQNPKSPGSGILPGIVHQKSR